MWSVRSETLGIKYFGDEVVKSAVRDIVELNLGNINRMEGVEIKAVVADNISAISNHVEMVFHI